MPIPQPGPRTADGEIIPSRLRLAFSKAADIGRLGRFFSPAIKSKIDPQNFVVKREKAIFESAIAGGHAAFLYDTASGEAFTVTMAYHVNDKNGEHRHTEIGTSITRLGGYKSAQLVIAALVLREWWEGAPKGLIVTEILPTNRPSLKVYRDHLGWSPVKEEEQVEELHRLCNEFIAPEDKGRQTIWFSCAVDILPKMAQILLDYLDNPTLRNKFTGHAVNLDLGELAAIGLTRNRLEALAKGITDKNLLQGPEQDAPRSGPDFER